MGKIKVGVALAGGGARGTAHIGILQVLQENQVAIDHLAGTSAGAIMAAMYAARPDGDWMEKRFAEFMVSGVFLDLGTERLARRFDKTESNPLAKRLKHHVVLNMSLSRQFIIPRKRLEAAIEFLVPAATFEELEIPLIVCAADLQAAQPVVYTSGDLVSAICNSASIPGVLESEIDENVVIADGGVLTPVPVEQLRDHTDFVIACDVSKRGMPPMQEINMYSLMMRAEQITQMALAQHQAARADFTFSPDVMALHWSQFGAFHTLVGNGRAEAEARVEILKRRIHHASYPLARLGNRVKRWLLKRWGRN